MSILPNLDSIASYARRLQNAACTITRPGDGDPVFDPETGEYDDPERVTTYTGSCMVQPASGERVVEFGEGPVSLRTFEFHLSGQADDVAIGQQVSVTGSRDDQLDASEKLVVIDVAKSTTFTNRVVIVEEQL